MDGDFRGGDACPQLLDLIPNRKDWMVRDAGGGGGDLLGVSEEKKLELRLGPPGGEDLSEVKEKREESSLLSLGYFSKVSKFTTTISSSGAKRGYFDGNTEVSQKKQPGFLNLQTGAGLGKELSHNSNGKAEQKQLQQQQSHDRKACCPSPAPSHATPASGNAAVSNNSSQTRTASVPVVGWPPIRSFRKNLASSSSKPLLETQNGSSEGTVKLENCRNGLFIKINMDGIPIGRKVDLKAYDSYVKLSSAVAELFRGLLAAQMDSPAAGIQKIAEEKSTTTGLLDGSGEYTLVYEDNEGDRMLVGDVPWDMFVSTAKRLRVLKSSDLPALSLGAVNRKRAADC